MKQMKGLFFLIGILSGLVTFAQEPLMPMMHEQDSMQLAAERQIIHYKLLYGIPPAGEWLQQEKLPDFNFNFGQPGRRDFGIPAFSADPWLFGIPIAGYARTNSTSFFRNETLLSGSAWQLNDRFTLGGYSFGADSWITAPFPNQGLNNFDFHGSTLFMHYNVSKNVRVETRINVTRGAGF